jgi:hypothetical protein
VRAASPTLALEWTAGSDGSGVASYRAGFSTSATAAPGELTSVAGSAQRRITFAPGEAQTLYAHVITYDSHGNSSANSFGPFHVDSPAAPDLIGGPADTGWLASGGSLVGVDSALALRDAQRQPQQIHATWDDSSLRLAWSGANWGGDGDLFVYIDSGSGGATALSNPYQGPAAAIGLPTSFGADWLVWVRDTRNATLMRWNGSAWAIEPSDPALYQFDANAARTDLTLPLDLLELGAAASVKVVAVASEEGALQLWAAFPDKNPLNSPRLAGADRAIGDFALTQAYALGPLAAGAEPNGGRQPGGDVGASLSSAQGGVAAAFLGDALFDLLAPGGRLDADGDGLADPGPLAGLSAPAVGAAQAVSYTLRYANRGAATAEDVRVSARAFGALRFAGGATTTSFDLGDLAAGISGTLTIDGLIDTAPGGQSAELALTLSDGLHGEFDWLWALHPVDSTAPQELTLVAGDDYARPGRAVFSGLVNDPGGVSSVTIEAAGQTTSCPQANPLAGSWSCEVDLGTLAGLNQVSVRARATDSFGNESAFTAPLVLPVDRAAPTVTLGAAVDQFLADGLIGAAELAWAGAVQDDNVARGVALCPSSAYGPECVVAPALPGDAAQGAWAADLGALFGGDSVPASISLFGLDASGLRTEPPLTRSFTVDTVAPLLGVAAGGGSALTGTVRDGGAITLRALVTPPGGGQTSVPLTLTPGQGGGFGWSYTPSGPAGSYLVSISAADQAGNASAQGPFVVEAAEAPTPTSTPSATPTPTPGTQGATVLVRHAPVLNSNTRVEGSLWLLAGEAMSLNGGATIAGDLLVPGSPAVTLNGSASIGSTVAGSGSAQPAGYRITLNGSSRVNRLVTRTDPIPVPAVPAPPAPTGTRNVVINQPGQSIGDPATIRNLTLNSNAGAVAVPPGAYGQWTANGSARFVIGAAGATTPSVYNLQGLTLNSSSRLEIVGPVTLNLASGMRWNGLTGSSANPHWLTVNVATGAVQLNSSSTLYGTLRAPSSTVTLNSSARLIGSVIADRLTLSSSAVIQAAP